VIHSCQVLDPGRDVQRFEVVSEVLKQGRQMAYSRSRIVDSNEPGRVLALTQGQGISIGTPPDGLEKCRWIRSSLRMARTATALAGLRSDAPHGRSLGAPSGLVGGGVTRCSTASRPQFVLLETAAFDLTTEVVGTDQVEAVSSHVMFLARGRSARFRAEAEPVTGSDGATAVRIVIHDEGDGDRAVTAGSYQFRVVG